MRASDDNDDWLGRRTDRSVTVGRFMFLHGFIGEHVVSFENLRCFALLLRDVTGEALFSSAVAWFCFEMEMLLSCWFCGIMALGSLEFA